MADSRADFAVNDRKGEAMRCALATMGVLVGFVCWGLSAHGEDEALIDDTALKPIEITISGQPIETPVLKYRLLPTEPELRPGNAAPILLRMTWDNARYFAETVPTFQKWETKPLDDPEWKESNGVLPEDFYSEMKRAAFRREAAWEYPLGEEPTNEILLPDVQGARTFFGDGLSAKARYHLGRREFGQARETILVGLAISRHFAKTPFFVVQAASSRNTRLMLERIDEMVGIPGSPNMYWALSVLPRPMFDLRPSTEVMQSGLEDEVPGLGDLDRPLSAEQWRELREKMFGAIEALGRFQQGVAVVVDKEAVLRYARETRPRWTSASSESKRITDDEALVRCFMWENTRLLQWGTTLMCLLPHEAIPALHDFEHQKAEVFKRMGIPAQAAAQLVLQDLGMYVFVWSAQRKIDALRVIEAIRAHLATHDGKLPEKLSDITGPSLPVDPLTNQSFGWKVSENVGRLSAPTIRGVNDPVAASLEYVLRVR